MFLRAVSLAGVIVALACALPEGTRAQDINSLKAGVVRIRNNLSGEVQVGAGFIVKVDGGQVYVATAAHVVKGNQHPDVYIFNRQRDPLQAEVLDRQEDDVKGLALLRLKVPSSIASGVTALKLSSTSQLGGGEAVQVIGFPDSTTFWTVDSGSIRRIEGHNLVFSGVVTGGNSGGPVILNGQVIGLVTDVNHSSAYAARAEVVELYVNGIEPNLTRAGTSATRQPENRQPADEFCQTLDVLYEVSAGGFSSVVGEAIGNDNSFKAKTLLPGATAGFVRPPKEVSYYLLIDKDRGKVESLFHTYVTKVRGCSTKWEEKEHSDSTYRYRKFRLTEGGAVLSVYYNPVAHHTNYYLVLNIFVPDARRREW